MASKTVDVEEMITVGDLADKLEIPVGTLITELMKNGIMATVNEAIDFDTAQIVVGEIDEEVELNKVTTEDIQVEKRQKRELDDSAQDRPPVVAVMGHVDHGKTSLLDAIRGSGEAEKEAGGITQHISAYQVTHNDRKVTFLDTPGHEAFAALREHGAKLTDVAIIVVAADDGVKPQTKEAIRFAQKAGVKIVVAINKIDKPGADVNRLKQQLSDEKLLIEEWGGDIVAVEVSAKEKTGIDKLLDMVLLIADVEELKADTDGVPEGLIIEAHMEQGRGAVGTALVEHGVLEPGMFISAGATFGKIRTLQSTDGQDIKTALPSTPVVISGFKKLPHFGDVFHVHKSEKEARIKAENAPARASSGNKKLATTSTELLSAINKDIASNELKALVRADVQGSLTSVKDSLQALENEEVSVRVIGSGIGSITESDVMMAAASNGIIYGFNVELPVNVKQLALREDVSIRIFKVIYELIDDIKEVLTSMLTPEEVETDVGRLIVKGIFRTTKSEIICGGEVTKGKAMPNTVVRIEREKEVLGEAEVVSVKRGQQESKEVIEGEMCGLQLKTDKKILLAEGDRLEFFTRETVARKL